MKTNKLLAAGALALSMAMTPVASLINAMPILAATINAPTDHQNHTYEVYQIFTGDLSNGKLSNIKWGTNSKRPEGKNVGDAVSSETITALVNAGKDANDKEKLTEITKYVDFETVPVAILDKDKPSENVADGYYIIKDKNDTVSGDDTYTLYITEVAGTVTITPKEGKPTVDKQVWDDADPTDQVAKWDETADHDLNETFKFKLKGTVDKSTLDKYDTYKMVFHDTLSKGVDYIGNVEVKVGNQTVAPSCYTGGSVTDNSDETKSFTVTFNDVKTLTNTSGGPINFDTRLTIEITYDAKLNSDAVINTSDDLNIQNKNDVCLEYSNNPNGEGTGQTEKDTVYVASFKLTNKKVDGSSKALAGAEFKLYNSDNKVARFDADNKFVAWDDSELTDNLPTGHHYAVASNAQGDFSMYGLDAGVYTLKETKTPAGYNTADDTRITVKATHTEDSDGNSAKVTLSQDSSLNTTVINTQNGSLPTTGGMGTTMIYSAGALLAVGAAVVYVTNKRTRKN